ncbi:MAG TPA: FMN-binding protein [Micromonosporaceae bacterium]|jgi:uncharacterized protein with FMN-binding domain
MRRIAYWLVSTAVLLVLLFTYRTSLSGPTSAQVVAGGTQAPGLVPATTPPSTPKAGRSRQPQTTHAPASGVSANGTVVDTVWGPVQVQVTIAGGKLTDVKTLIYPTGTGRDQEINSYALPILRREALTAQSANISTVSGATYTSGGYRQSLQAALDAAHFGG